MSKKITERRSASSEQKVSEVRSHTERKTDRPDAIRVLVVIKQRIFRAGLCALLSDDAEIDVVGNAGDCAECCRHTADLIPDVLVCGLDSGCGNGNDNLPGHAVCPKALSDSCQAPAKIPIIILHEGSDEWTLWKTAKTGVRGILTTNTRPDYLLLAIREVNGGGFFIEPALQSRLIDTFHHPEQHSGSDNQPLTKREWEVLALLAQGKRNQGIAEELFMSESAVKHHVSTLLRKFRVSNRTEAVRAAIARGLIDPPT